MTSFAKVAAAAAILLGFASVASAQEASRYSCQPTGSEAEASASTAAVDATCQVVDGEIDAGSCTCPTGYVLVDTGARPAAITPPPANVTPG